MLVRHVAALSLVGSLFVCERDVCSFLWVIRYTIPPSYEIHKHGEILLQGQLERGYHGECILGFGVHSAEEERFKSPQRLSCRHHIER